MKTSTYLLAAFHAMTALLTSSAASAASAAQCEKQSPAHRLALVELYTSEGCNSCPPADRWLRRIDTRNTTDRDIVPLALHVDYWDSLGWRDVFSQHIFTERQEQLTRLGTTRFSYTPELFVNGREFRNWRSEEEFRSAMKAINAKPAAANIHLTWTPATDNRIKIEAEFSAIDGHKTGSAAPQAYVAVYENRLSNKVSAGENNGATLQHDYVVRQWKGPIYLDGKTAIADIFKLPVGRDGKHADVSNLGVAAFVQDSKTGEILQALALPAC
ncbi:hypothetical protein hmeg3_00995 [Herbaspirillum sp. meg3]|jgi:hypothetical protein|uniref:DUF1223 domain-containing protein n=1 Tax=Herbaspirillum sp. meg3 TaxID=2025949 RepID=UPI000B97CB51|nr:DUF1223 domain-containing protein [Herbaspirillum sp. meg3]ASU37004.1 hypothetical protein hmeg3_00995 [Herbaspirillum sp. meg3]